MRANLYLHKDSFEYNGLDSEEVFAKKLKAFVADIAEIRLSHLMDDVFISSCDIQSCEVYRDTTFLDAIEKYLDGDMKPIMYDLVADISIEREDISLADISGFCSYRSDEKEVNAIVVLNKEPVAVDKTHYIEFDRYEIVYSRSSWFHFRRQVLGNHPGDPASFIHDCRILFPGLCFHDNCVLNLCDEEYEYLKIVPRAIVYYLSCLNDGFKGILSAHMDKAPDANSILKDFSSSYGLPEMGSLQRNASKKPILTFEFLVTSPPEKSGQLVKVLCEPHLKITKPDDNFQGKVGKRFNPRIYFSFGDSSIENGRIPVGSIGKHLA